MLERPGVGVVVRPVVTEDIPRLSHSLARAFHDDPVSIYLFPNEARRQRQLERYFRFHLRALFLPKGEAWTTPGLEAASLWLQPQNRAPSIGEVTQIFPVLAILGRRMPRAIRLVQLLESHHPRGPHAYLGTIGTDPDAQRRGLGSALLRVVLDRCDTEGLPSYLESSKEENLAFYNSHGYKVLRDVVIPKTTVKLWLMWREPGAG